MTAFDFLLVGMVALTAAAWVTLVNRGGGWLAVRRNSWRLVIVVAVVVAWFWGTRLLSAVIGGGVVSLTLLVLTAGLAIWFLWRLRTESSPEMEREREALRHRPTLIMLGTFTSGVLLLWVAAAVLFGGK
jgi:hypothetical protein